MRKGFAGLRAASITAGAAFAALLPIAPASAQEVVELAAPTAEADDPLSSLSGLREMSDGSVLVADGLEGRLVRVTPDLGSATPVGREGAGPREYRTPDALYATAADSTLMVDLGNGRLSVLAPDGAIVRSVPIAGGDGPAMTIRIPGGVDAEGRVYFRRMPGPGAMRMDSAMVARFDPRSESTVELTSVKLPGMSVSSSGGANERQEVMRPMPLTFQDAWAVTPDGSLVVARSDATAYWLEVHGSDGVRRGPRIAYEPIRVREADKQAWIDALSGGLGVSVEVENGRQRTTFSRGDAPSLDPDDLEWPETKPPFPGNALRAAPDGRHWLERHVAAGEGRRFDVLDADGRRVGSVRLPEDRQLVGFGESSVYLSRTDALDFVWLERYALPAL